MKQSRHPENHRSQHIGWLRAAVLGANDGTISIASLIVGVAAGGASSGTILLTGIAGLFAGAMSMAAGEYVSVQSQADTENADLAKEKHELATEPEKELQELTDIYINRGLDADLAAQVALQLTEKNALEAHARDELGITEELKAKPITAALTSAAAFTVGAIVPIITALVSPKELILYTSAITTLLMLFIFGAMAAYTGGAPIIKGALRVAFWGALAMAITALAGKFFGA